MKFENTEVFNFEGAIRGMRNPLESWDKSDSDFEYLNCEQCKQAYEYKNTECKKSCIGEKDFELMQKLIKAGSEHRKFMRQIMVSVDITAPLYWWKEFSTYKLGTVANSTSTMHKLAITPITIDCFECPDLIWKDMVNMLEGWRQDFLKTNNKDYWKKLIVNLPESWLQKRTVTMNYENLLNMVHQRQNHKLTEWSDSFISWARSLPYAQELIFIKEATNEAE